MPYPTPTIHTRPTLLRRIAAWPLALAVIVGGACILLAAHARSLAAGDQDPYADNNCVQCHANLPGRSAEIVELEWKQSVHYTANIGCESCHGGDAQLRRDQFDSDQAFKEAAHLEREADFLVAYQAENEFVSTVRGRNVSYFCGKCHSNIKEKHLGSPHGAFGDPTCLYCHSDPSHRITKPSPEIVDTRSRAEGGRCAACHHASTMETVRRVKETMVQAEENIARSTALNEELAAWQYRSLSLEQMHQGAAEVNSALRQVFHSFNMREINTFANQIRDNLEQVEATHGLIENLRRAQFQQAITGAAAVVWLLGFSGLLVYYKKKFLDPEHEHSDEPAPMPDDDNDHPSDSPRWTLRESQESTH